jgi:hypothetical protein
MKPMFLPYRSRWLAAAALALALGWVATGSAAVPRQILIEDFSATW